MPAVEKFFKMILDFLFDFRPLYYYTIEAVALFAALYLIGFIASFCGKLSAIKKAEKILLSDPCAETAEESIERMPAQVRAAFYTAKLKGKKNPAAALTYDVCVKTPYAFSVASKFTKYSFILTLLLSFFAYAFFTLGASYTGEAGFISHMNYVMFGYAVAGLIGTGIAAIISFSRYRRASKRYVAYSEQLVQIYAAQSGTDPYVESNQTYAGAELNETETGTLSADELIVRINTLSSENASIGSLKEAAYMLQQERVKPENANPVQQRKLNDALNVLIKAMSNAVKNP